MKLKLIKRREFINKASGNMFIADYVGNEWFTVNKRFGGGYNVLNSLNKDSWESWFHIEPSEMKYFMVDNSPQIEVKADPKITTKVFFGDFEVNESNYKEIINRLNKAFE